MTTAIAHSLSAALLHFVWQGLLAGFLLWVALFVMRKRSANSRYLASCIALAILSVMPAITAYVLYHGPTAVTSAEPPPAAAPRLMPADGKMPASPEMWMAAWQSWAIPVWSIGVLLFSLRLAWGCKQVSSLRRQGTPATATLLSTVASLGTRLGLTRRVRVLITLVADGPSVVGWIRPIVLLPSATLLGLTTDQLEAVLAHELAHIRRHDYLVNLVQILVETLLFYHPAVWWMSTRIRQERELCCDDLAVGVCGDALCYARALTKLERLRVATPGLAMAGTGGPLMYRIQRLIGVGGQEYGPSKLSGILALCLGLACFAMNVHWARGQSQEESKPRGYSFKAGQFIYTSGAATLVEERDSAGVSVDAGSAAVLSRPSVEYPGPALEKNIQGTVTAEVTLDASGEVTDARIVSGPPELRRAVLQSILDWRFLPNSTQSVRQVSVTFEADVARRRQAEELTQAVTDLNNVTVKVRVHGTDSNAVVRPDLAEVSADKIELTTNGGETRNEILRSSEDLTRLTEQLGELERKIDAARNIPTSELEKNVKALSFLREERESLLNRLVEKNSEKFSNPAEAVGHKLARIDVSGFSDEARQAILSRLPVHIGDTLSEGFMDRIRGSIEPFDDHVKPQVFWRLTQLENGDINLYIVLIGPNSSEPALRIRH